MMQVLDLAVVAFVYVIAVKAYPHIRLGETLDETAHFGLLPVFLIFFAVSRGLVAKNVELRSRTLHEQTVCIIKEVGLTFGFVVILLFLLKLSQFSRVVLVSFGIGVTLALILVREFMLWFYFRRKGDSTDHHLRVLIIGSGRRARTLGDQLQKSSEWGIQIVGYLDPLGESAGRRAGDQIFGHVDDISLVLRDNVVEDVVVAVPRSMLGDVQKIIDACQEEGVRLRFMADIYDFEAARIRLTQVNNIPLLSFEPVAREEGALLAKRIFDLVVTLLATPVLVPVMLFVAVAIKIDSKGPVFFMQDRIGLHKRPFTMYKFRSMVLDAEERMKDVEHLNEADGPNFKIENDPRVTRVGRFIRRTSIDEIPQLFNVILGDMSLVGPRPMSKRDVQLFDKGVQRKRFSVRPGITCIWQVSGRSDLSFDDWLKLDIQYIDSWTFWLDLRILLKTIPTVLRGSGAS
jgi:exopolysaccharide biosynthesis polyprenyl glycosylphosphotransferase